MTLYPSVDTIVAAADSTLTRPERVEAWPWLLCIALLAIAVGAFEAYRRMER